MSATFPPPHLTPMERGQINPVIDNCPTLCIFHESHSGDDTGRLKVIISADSPR